MCVKVIQVWLDRPTSMDYTRLVKRITQHPKIYMETGFSRDLYLTQRELFIRTDGRFNLEVNKLIANERKIKIDSDSIKDQLINKEEAISIVKELREKGGYSVRQAQFSKDDLDQAKRMIDEKESIRHKSMKNEELARTIENNLRILKKLDIVKKLIIDKSIKYIADQYLGCNSILNYISLWKTSYVESNIHNQDRDAMRFHFDCDHNRFLKIFIYLDDVTRMNGPHVYIPMTNIFHRSSLPVELKRDGRIKNREIINKGLVPEYIIGKKSTIIFGDTSSLHRGTAVQKGMNRYLIQLQYVDSIAGAESSHSDKEIEELNPLVW